MIVVRLWGGLGNQLFQYAFGYSLAKMNHTNFIIDTRFFSEKYLNNNKRFSKREADIFNMHIEKIDFFNHNSNMAFAIHALQNKYINKIIRIFPRFKFHLGLHNYYIKETRKKYIKIGDLNESKTYYFDGYWQDLKYFNEYKKDFIKQFRFITNEVKVFYKANMNGVNSVSLHVRRGDYLSRKNKHLGLLTENYYLKAVETIKNKYDNLHFFIFTQDVEWVKQNLIIDYNTTIITQDYGFSDLEEFQLMKMCNHNIIANSTFSWWAAYLNTNNDKTVIAPEISWGKNIIENQWLIIKD